MEGVNICYSTQRRAQGSPHNSGVQGVMAMIKGKIPVKVTMSTRVIDKIRSTTKKMSNLE